jgi:hypothetical protein
VFRSPESRTLLRAIASAVMLALGVLAANLADGELSTPELIGVLSAFATGFGGWYGLGAVSPTEPYLGVGNPAVVEVPPDPPTVVEPGHEG